IHDNFFALGGDSILSIQVVSRAAQAGLALTPRALFQAQTIAKLAQRLGEQVSNQGVQEEPEQLSGEVALTPIQCWFFAQDLPEPQHYNQSLLLQARQPVQPSLLKHALQALVHQHASLRLRFEREEAGWRQWYEEESRVQVLLEQVDLSMLNEH